MQYATAEECSLGTRSAGKKKGGGLKEQQHSPRNGAARPLRVLQQLPDFFVKGRGVVPDLVLGDGRSARVAAPVRDLLDDLGEHGFGDAQAHALGVDEGVLAGEKLLDGRTARWVAVEAHAEGALEAGGHGDVADAVVRVCDGVVAVHDGEDAAHLIRDVGEGRLAVDHLIQNAAQAPHVAGLAERHVLGAFAVLELASCAAGAVF